MLRKGTARAGPARRPPPLPSPPPTVRGERGAASGGEARSPSRGCGLWGGHTRSAPLGDGSWGSRRNGVVSPPCAPRGVRASLPPGASSRRPRPRGWPGLVPRPRRRRARASRVVLASFFPLVSLARGCPLRRRPAGRRGVRPPMRALPEVSSWGGEGAGKRPRRRAPCVPRAPARPGRLREGAVVGGFSPPFPAAPPWRPVPLYRRVAGPCSRDAVAAVPSLSPASGRPPRPSSGFDRWARKARGRSCLPLSLGAATSDQTWRPAEFKHISQRRKRN